MKKPRKILSLLFIAALTFSMAACGGKAAPAEEPQERCLYIVWPTLDIDFYSTMADVMKGQAEDAGWKVEVVSYDFDSGAQAVLLEDCETQGVTAINKING